MCIHESVDHEVGRSCRSAQILGGGAPPPYHRRLSGYTTRGNELIAHHKPETYSPSVIRLVLFDIDGTLIRTNGAGVRAFERTLEFEFQVRDGAKDVKFAGRTDPSIVRDAFALHRIPPTREHFDRFFEAYVFWLDAVLRESDGGACEGVLDFISELKALRHPPRIGLLTGNIRLGAEIKLRHYDLWGHYTTGAFGDEHEDRNELARIAHRRGQRHVDAKLRGDEILVIGDTPLDIACANAIGARMLAVATGGATREELRRHRPRFAVRDLAEIPADEACA